MSRSKIGKFDTSLENEEFMLLLKHAYWSLKSSCHMSESEVLEQINSGMLGYRKENGKKIPIKISESTYYRHKKQFTEMPQAYEDIRQMAIHGFVTLLNGFNAELKTLHTKVSEILYDKNLKPMEQLKVISILCREIIPTQSALADISKMLYVMSTRDQKIEKW